MKPMKVGLVQMTSNEDVARNLLELFSSYDKLKNQTDLIITPENTLFMRTSRTAAMRSFALDGPELSEIQKKIDQDGTPLLLGSIPLKSDQSDKLMNAMIFLEPGSRPKVVYEKHHLFDVDVDGQPPVRESEVFSPGRMPKILNFRGYKIGLSICYDLRFSGLYLEYAKCGVDVIVIPSAFLVPTGQAHWHVLTRARAIECQCYVVAPAQGGRTENSNGAFRETYGHSIGIDPWGQVVLELTAENPTGVIEIDRVRIERVRSQIPMAGHRRDFKGVEDVEV